MSKKTDIILTKDENNKIRELLVPIKAEVLKIKPVEQQQQSPMISIPKVWVCVCTLDMVYIEWILKTYTPFLKPPSRPFFDAMMRFGFGPISIGQKRDTFIQDVLDNHPEVTHIFFLDNDVILENNINPIDALNKLLALDLPIVSGVIRTKKIDVEIMLYKKAPPEVIKKIGELNYKAVEALIDDGSGIMEVDACGAGFLLIKKEVFTKIPRPWFQITSTNDGLTEDIEFCNRITKAGEKIYAYLPVRLSHLGNFKLMCNGEVSVLYLDDNDNLPKSMKTRHKIYKPPKKQSP
jgi:hypothetical protein